MKSGLLLAVVFSCYVHVLSDVNFNRKPPKPSTLCYDQIDDPYVQFATKTGYRVNQNKDEDEIQYKGFI